MARAFSARPTTTPHSNNWKGGRVYRGPYIYIWLPDHPNAQREGYVAEHRLVMSNELGRPLLPREFVHHKDGDTHNNDPANLQVVDPREHLAVHKAERGNHWGWRGRPECCTVCGTTERPHSARGMCLRCYAREAYRRKKDRASVVD